ncbi:hypothetical protein OCU04_006498 [Sclerotinia nivalis]|uniref:Uncharacterized protein n=1 Tax=Sclerotinia nivalis TaxID=352851 RepID=A0A9X0DIG4_9HELO|nr:hypothetical protein OCU04_006498 [Sclerotinia nivalis]
MSQYLWKMGKTFSTDSRSRTSESHKSDAQDVVDFDSQSDLSLKMATVQKFSCMSRSLSKMGKILRFSKTFQYPIQSYDARLNTDFQTRNFNHNMVYSNTIPHRNSWGEDYLIVWVNGLLQ